MNYKGKKAGEGICAFKKTLKRHFDRSHGSRKKEKEEYFLFKKKFRARGVVQVVECLCNKCKGWSSRDKCTCVY
jgi:hypothetical protein